MGALALGRTAYRGLRDRLGHFLRNDDPLAAAANTGSFLVWSSQPLYPLYVWLVVGRDAWPSLLTWLSTPFFVAVTLVGRRHPLASRILFVVAGVLNTLLSVKALGTQTSVGWFLVPCAIIAATFFRKDEWAVALMLTIMTLVAALLVPHLGAPLHAYDVKQAEGLMRLNLWSVAVLSIYLLVSAFRARRSRH